MNTEVRIGWGREDVNATLAMCRQGAAKSAQVRDGFAENHGARIGGSFAWDV
jgi:hypothetical protein